MKQPPLISAVVSAGHVSANPDSAEDIGDDSDAAVDEEEDDEEVLVEEDQMQTSVCAPSLVTQQR